ncbi:MAG TPA: dienelactone hydrolase family protein [Gammaproteobacteria bacterium]|jgi:carboxymethylenebutenolidase|nr:dienelactone hydrolase family protein [Gammaproteobacteria bacterium]
MHALAKDGHIVDLYVAKPKSEAVATVIVLQEIFGITDHIKDVCKQYAAHGYLAIAPALFDRIKKNIVLDYSSFAEGRDYKMQLQDEQVLLDIAASAATAENDLKVAVIGFCFGGALSYLASTRLNLDCAISYYGGGIAEKYINQKPLCPIMYHFGALDPIIPSTDVAAIQSNHPEGVFHIYEDAGHGFNCSDRRDYHSESAKIAFARSLEFLKMHI